MLAAAVAVLGLQAPLPVSRVAQSRLGGVRMASDEPWFEDCVSTTSIDKSAFECAAPPQSTWPCSNWHGRLAAAGRLRCHMEPVLCSLPHKRRTVACGHRVKLGPHL